MKRLILLPLALLTTVMSWATMIAPADFRVITKDGSVAYFCGFGTELSFSQDGTILTITTEGENSTVNYAVSGIEAIEFDQAGTYSDKYSYSGSQISVAAPTDEYSQAKEDVITDDTHDDYGDFIENYTPKNTVTITYDGDKATFSGNPSGVRVVANGAHVTVTSTKKDIAYTLKGTTTDGSFKLYSDKKTQISLSGVSITNPKGAAINIQSGKTMLIDITDGTQNHLEDGATYTTSMGEDQKGTFFSEGQLVFSGKGTLEVLSHGGHGIVSDDYVRVRGGNITVNSVRDGVNTNDRFIMYGGTLTVEAQQDGLDIGKGYIEIGGGKLSVNAVDEGITASYEGESDGSTDPAITPYITIKGGLIKVTTTGDKGHALRSMSTLTMSGGNVQATVEGAGSKALMSEDYMMLSGGKLTAHTTGDALYETDIKELTSSAALRSKGKLVITDMTIGLMSTGDGAKAINNVGDIVIRRSAITAVTTGERYVHDSLDSRARGITTDGAITIEAGTLQVKSYDTPLHVAGKYTFSNKAVYTGYQLSK